MWIRLITVCCTSIQTSPQGQYAIPTSVTCNVLTFAGVGVWALSGRLLQVQRACGRGAPPTRRRGSYIYCRAHTDGAIYQGSHICFETYMYRYFWISKSSLLSLRSSVNSLKTLQNTIMKCEKPRRGNAMNNNKSHLMAFGFLLYCFILNYNLIGTSVVVCSTEKRQPPYI